MPYTTVFNHQKELKKHTGQLSFNNAKIKGYEIHQGQTQFDYTHNKPFAKIDNGDKEGLISNDDQIIATYLHGVFDEPEALTEILNWAGLDNTAQFDLNAFREQQINRLANCYEQHLDIEKIKQLLSIQ